MGCCQYGVPLPTEASREERAITAEENALGYGSWPTKQVIDEVLRLSEDGRFSVSDFNTLAEKFNLRKNDIDSIDSKMYQFYKQIKDKAFFNVERLCLLVVLLSHGTPNEKARQLFRVASMRKPGEEASLAILNEGRLDELLELIYNISCEWLPCLCRAETISEPGTLQQDKVENIIQSYRANKTAALAAYKSGILEGRLGASQTDFEIALTSPKCRGLTSPFEFRRVVLSH